MLVLDTDHLSALAWDSQQAQRLRMRVASVAPDEVATTIVTFEEQMRGRLAYLARARTLSDQIEGYRRLRTQLDNYQLIPVLDFTERAAAEFQRLRVRVGTMDLKIAAIALANSATLLSRQSRRLPEDLGSPGRELARVAPGTILTWGHPQD